jgi:hypothetical protein
MLEVEGVEDVACIVVDDMEATDQRDGLGMREGWNEDRGCEDGRVLSNSDGTSLKAVDPTR